MKKILAMIAAMAMLGAMVSCGGKKDESSEGSEIVTTTEPTTAELTTEAEPETTAPEIAEPTTEATTSAGDPTKYEEKEEGGVVFDAPVEKVDESALIEAAQLLFDKACRTQWDYTVGSPYELDHSQTAKNMYGWDCFLVVTDGVNSLDDVKRDFHRVFSEDFEDNLKETYVEANGHVYCLDGQRGSDIFYISSEILSVDSRSDEEIVFTVGDKYSDDDFGNGETVQKRTFAISVDSDGAWRVSKFKLPY